MLAIQHLRLFWPLFWLSLFAVSAAIVAFASFPFVIIAVVWITALAWAIEQASSTARRVICVTAIILLAIFLALEINWAIKKTRDSNTVMEQKQSADFSYPDPLLGFRLTPEHIEKSEKYVDGKLSYSVVYRTDRNGWRVTPQLESPVDDRCILFFGGSDTFGDGVEDHETVPYRLSQLLNRKVFNFGMSGGGPHQMLALIEFEQLPQPLGCDPYAAIFYTSPGGVKRSAGMGQYGKHGPRYRIDTTGRAEYAGQFGTHGAPTRASKLMQAMFRKSYVYQEYAIDRDYISQADIRLYAAVVATAKERLQKKHPGIKFIVLNANTTQRAFALAIDSQLAKIADQYLRLTDIIPRLNEDDARTEFFLPRDPHLVPATQDLIARYLATILACPDGTAVHSCSSNGRKAMQSTPQQDAR